MVGPSEVIAPSTDIQARASASHRPLATTAAIADDASTRDALLVVSGVARHDVPGRQADEGVDEQTGRTSRSAAGQREPCRASTAASSPATTSQAPRYDASRSSAGENRMHPTGYCTASVA